MKVTSEEEHEGLYQPKFWLNLHLWREILLNACPSDSCASLQDGSNRRYWLEGSHSETGVKLTIHYRGGVVAHAVMKWAGPDEAILEDILVASSVQKRGLATRLLDHATVLAKHYGANWLTGRVIRKDAERNPALLDWYKRRGFEVKPVQVVSAAEPALVLNTVALRSQAQYETIATIRLKLEYHLAAS